MAEEVLFAPLLTQQAPSKSREILEQARRHFGFVPNLLASMAHSPVALSVYFYANVGFEFGTLTLAERQIVLLTASKENKCAYCSASHSALARFFANVLGTHFSRSNPGKIRTIRSGMHSFHSHEN